MTTDEPPPPDWDATVELDLTQCPGCAAGHHEWTEIEHGPETAAVRVHRGVCTCPRCIGTCPARRTEIEVLPGYYGLPHNQTTSAVPGPEIEYDQGMSDD